MRLAEGELRRDALIDWIVRGLGLRHPAVPYFTAASILSARSSAGSPEISTHGAERIDRRKRPKRAIIGPREGGHYTTAFRAMTSR